MKSKKLYFENHDSEFCYSIDHFLKQMIEKGQTEIDLYEAIRELKTDHFFCKAVGEFEMKGDGYESCGKECEDYIPRNGKSGCCIHRGYCYVPDKLVTISINKMKYETN